MRSDRYIPMCCGSLRDSRGLAPGWYSPQNRSRKRGGISDNTRDPARVYHRPRQGAYEKGRELADEAAQLYEDGRHLVEDTVL